MTNVTERGSGATTSWTGTGAQTITLPTGTVAGDWLAIELTNISTHSVANQPPTASTGLTGFTLPMGGTTQGSGSIGGSMWIGKWSGTSISLTLGNGNAADTHAVSVVAFQGSTVAGLDLLHSNDTQFIVSPQSYPSNHVAYSNCCQITGISGSSLGAPAGWTNDAATSSSAVGYTNSPAQGFNAVPAWSGTYEAAGFAVLVPAGQIFLVADNFNIATSGAMSINFSTLAGILPGDLVILCSANTSSTQLTATAGTGWSVSQLTSQVISTSAQAAWAGIYASGGDPSFSATGLTNAAFIGFAIRNAALETNSSYVTGLTSSVTVATLTDWVIGGIGGTMASASPTFTAPTGMVTFGGVGNSSFAAFAGMAATIGQVGSTGSKSYTFGDTTDSHLGTMLFVIKLVAAAGIASRQNYNMRPAVMRSGFYHHDPDTYDPESGLYLPRNARRKLVTF